VSGIWKNLDTHLKLVVEKVVTGSYCLPLGLIKSVINIKKYHCWICMKDTPAKK